MEKRQRVFIKGVQGRGYEVIKALTDCGAYGHADGDRDNAIYYINHNGIIDYASIHTEIAKIIMDDYHEIKLPERWGDGNILFSETDDEFAVFEAEHIRYPDKFISYLTINSKGEYMTYKDIYKKAFRLATKSEIEQFYKCLHAINKDWDTEKKQLIDWVWRPSINEAYYTLEIDNGDVVVRTRVYFDDDIDKKLIKNCNFFRTIEEAEEAVDRVKKALKGKYSYE